MRLRLSLFHVIATGLMVAPLLFPASSWAGTKLRDHIRGWAISEEHRDGRFYRCFAETEGAGNTGLRFSIMRRLDRHLTLLGAPFPPGQKPHLLAIFQPGGARFPLEMIPRAGEGLWAPAPLSNTFVDALDQSQALVLQDADGRESRRFSLGDTETMFAALDGCMSQNGVH